MHAIFFRMLLSSNCLFKITSVKWCNLCWLTSTLCFVKNLFKGFVCWNKIFVTLFILAFFHPNIKNFLSILLEQIHFKLAVVFQVYKLFTFRFSLLILIFCYEKSTCFFFIILNLFKILLWFFLLRINCLRLDFFPCLLNLD